MRVARVILGAMIMLAILWANIPSSAVATGPICRLACCADTPPHARWPVHEPLMPRGSDSPRQDNAHLPSICQLKNLSSSAVFREHGAGECYYKNEREQNN